MKIYEVNQIVEYMENIYPSKAQSNYESIAKRYLDISVNECLKGYNESTEPDRIDFRISTLNENILNRYNSNKYWLPLLKSNFPFFYTIQKGWKTGDVAIISSVKPVFSQLACLGYFVNQDNAQLLTELHPQHGTNINTPIDIPNLTKYIDNTIEGIDNPKYAKGVKTLCKHLYQAKSILDIATHTGGYLPQSYTVKATGRTYMNGINLQTVSTEVREAALGPCFKYDLRTSMFAHMLHRITEKYPDFNVKGSHINEYITNKKYVRKMLADKCLTHTQTQDFVKIKLIKKTLSAIGFGANVSNSYGAIKQNIYHKSDRDLLLANNWMKGLLTEVELYREIMRMSYPRAKKEFGEALKKNGRSSLSKWCSFEYQLTESGIVQMVSNKLGAENILLQVHDALYVNHRCDLVDLNWEAHKISPLANFESEQIFRVGYNARLDREQAVVEATHKQNIIQEEIKAFEEYLT